MGYRTLFLLNSFVAFLLGLAFLVVPTMAISQFGVDSYTSTKMIAQFFGTAMLTLGLLLWFAKDVTSEAVQRHMGISLLVGSLAGALVTVLGTVSGTLRANAWIAIVVYILFGLGYAYLVFMKKPQTSP
jgi:ABC-type Mn2+/Zn2+ transport system permease subunit